MGKVAKKVAALATRMAMSVMVTSEIFAI